MTRQKIILTGGKFNRIHPGHVWLLRKAKKLGYLVVILAHDTHNKRHYSLPAAKRKKMVETLGIADKVVVGDSKKFSKVLEKFKPDVIVLGYDQRFPDNESKLLAKKTKIKVIKLRKHGDYSSRKLRS